MNKLDHHPLLVHCKTKTSTSISQLSLSGARLMLLCSVEGLKLLIITFILRIMLIMDLGSLKLHIDLESQTKSGNTGLIKEIMMDKQPRKR